MIQRIQSLFLLLASGSLFSLFARPMAFVEVAGDRSEAGAMLSDGVLNIEDNQALLAMAILAGVGFLASIFLFKNRHRQILIAKLASFGSILLLATAAFFFYQNVVTMGGAISIMPSLGTLVTVLGVALGFIAIRYIRKDEKLVRSIDRLR